METLRLRLAADSESDIARDPALLQAAEILRAGGLVAFPTETVYGLGANALDAAAVEKIFAAKQRPHWDPVIVHVADVAAARALTTSWPDSAARLAEVFWPGPLTMLLPRSPAIPDLCTAGRANVGLRLPAHPVARALIAAAGVPVAAPSANIFGHISPTTAEHVLADLDGRIDAVLDAGGCAVGVESTVLDPVSTPPLIYRPGGVTAEQLKYVLGNVEMALRTVSDEVPREALESPGFGIRHYAPRARVVLVASEGELMQVLKRETRHNTVGVLLPFEWRSPLVAVTVVRWGSWSEPQQLARDLYAQLRVLDDQGVEVIVCSMPPAEGIGMAIRDRLRKASQ
ncbi:MAG: L-threonylcarbamoyladenylate synthase [Candidatus Korobacteraceae bacterium]